MPVDLVQLLHSSIGRIIRGLDANIFKLWLRQACILSPIVGIVIQLRNGNSTEDRRTNTINIKADSRKIDL